MFMRNEPSGSPMGINLRPPAHQPGTYPTGLCSMAKQNITNHGQYKPVIEDWLKLKIIILTETDASTSSKQYFSWLNCPV